MKINLKKAEKYFKHTIIAVKRSQMLIKGCYIIFASSMKFTYLAWWEDKEGLQVGMSHCTRTDHSQLQEQSQGAAQMRPTGRESLVERKRRPHDGFRIHSVSREIKYGEKKSITKLCKMEKEIKI